MTSWCSVAHLNPDPHHFRNRDTYPHQSENPDQDLYESESWIRQHWRRWYSSSWKAGSGTAFQPDPDPHPCDADQRDLNYTVQTVDLILPCIGRIPQLHSCIEKKILLNSLCWLGDKFMLSSSKQVGTGPWFESPMWPKINIKFFKDKQVWIYLWQGLLYFKD